MNLEKFVEVSMQVQGDRITMNLETIQDSPIKSGRVVDIAKLEDLADRVLDMLR